MEIENSSSQLLFNLTEYRGELYSNVQLIFFFVVSFPTIVLCFLTNAALLIAKDINWMIRFILISLFVSEIIFAIGMSLIFWGHPIRKWLNITTVTYLVCNVTISFQLTGNATKVGSITFYSIMAYIFIKYNIKKVRWYMVAMPLAVIWLVSICFSVVVFVVIKNIVPTHLVYKGFCPLTLEDNNDHSQNGKNFLIQLGTAWILEGVLCTTIIVVFSILIFRYMRNISNDAIKKAIAKNLLFLSIGGLLSISNAVIYPTIFFFQSYQPDADLDKVFSEVLATNIAIDLLRCLASIYTPFVTIALLKPVRDAMRQMRFKCCKVFHIN